MKSALVIILTDNAGGAERVAVTLANRLSQSREWRVELMIMGRRESESFVETAASPSVERKYGRFARERFSFLSLPLRIVGRRYDLVFTTHVHTNALLSLMRRVSLVRTPCLIARESTTVFDRFVGARRAIFKGLYRLYGTQNLIIAQTRYMADHVVPHLPSRVRPRVRVLPNPIDLEAIDREAAAPLSEPVALKLAGRENILFCGRLIEVKQPLVAVAAYALAASRLDPDLRPRLVFMGNGPLLAEIEAAARAEGLGPDDVVLVGRQANPYAIMRRCEYGLLTSSREGFPNVVLEMMGSGVRKIVVTPCAGDLERLTGVTVTSGFDAGTLAEALIDAISTREDRREDYRRVVMGRSIDRFVDEMLVAAGIDAIEQAGPAL